MTENAPAPAAPAPETPAAPAPDASPTPAPAEQPRKGFSPLLVLLTVAVVVFVLWFCPRALRWAYDQEKPAPIEIVDD